MDVFARVGAAYAAGYLSQSDAMRIAYFRGVCCLKSLSSKGGKRGGMMATNITPDEAQKYLQGLPPQSIVVACVNSPSNITLSGDVDQIDLLEKKLQSDGKFARKLRVEMAYHSPHMETVADDYYDSLGVIRPINRHQGKVRMVSTVTKGIIDHSNLTAEYWVRNLINPVEFAAAVTNITHLSEPGRTRRTTATVKWSFFLELGPHEALKSPVSQTLRSVNDALIRIPYHAMIIRKQDAIRSSLNVAGVLWSMGHGVDLAVVNRTIDFDDAPTARVMSDLPAYPWNHRASFWHEPLETTALRHRTQPRHDILGVPIDFQNWMEPRWRQILRISENPWIADHIVAGSVMYPAAGMVMMVAEAARHLSQPSGTLASVELHDVNFFRSLVITDDEDDRGLQIMLHVVPIDGMENWYQFRIFSLPRGASWTNHASGKFTFYYKSAGSHVQRPQGWQQIMGEIQETKATVSQDFTTNVVYKWLSETGGVKFGPSFQTIKQVSFCSTERRLVIQAVATDTCSTMPQQCESPSFLHPTLLDTLFQAAVMSQSDALTTPNAEIPIGFERLLLSTEFQPTTGSSYIVHAKCRNNLLPDCVATDPSLSSPGVLLEGVRLGRVPMSDDAATASKKGIDSRYSSIVWKEHNESFERFRKTFSAADFQDWVKRLCHTRADITALVITNGLSGQDWIKLLQPVAPQCRRPRLQTLVMAMAGDEMAGKSSIDTELLSGARFIEFTSIGDLAQAGVHDVLYDLVLIDQPTVYNEAENVPSADQLPISLVKEEGWLLIPTSGFEIDNASMETRAVLQMGKGKEFALLRKATPSHLVAPEIYILAKDIRDIPHDILDELTQALGSLGTKVLAIGLAELSTVAGKPVISLIELTGPWLPNWDAESLQQFRQLTKAEYILWLSPLGEDSGLDQVHLAATTGLLRTIRNEIPGITIPQVQFDNTCRVRAKKLVTGLIEVMQLTMRKGPRKPDLEYRLEDDRLLVPRLIEASEVVSAMRSEIYGPEPVMSALIDDQRCLTLVHDKGKSYWDLRRNLESMVLRADHLEIRVRAATLANIDPNGPPEVSIKGIEVVGKVCKVGGAVHGFRVGDQVLVATEDTAVSTILHVRAASATRLPAQLDPMQGVSMPFAYTAAYQCLFHNAHLGLDSSLLVVGNLNQTTRAVIHHAQACGLQLYVATKLEHEKEAVCTQYSLPEEDVYLASEDVVTLIKQRTKGKGIDATLCTIGGNASHMAARCLADGGTFIDAGNNVKLAALPNDFVSRGCSYTGLRLRNAGDISAMFNQALELICLSKVPTVSPYAVFPACKHSDALRANLQSGTRVILDLEAPGLVPIIPPVPEPVSVDGESTYVLAGGLGTLGLALAETLVHLGARHLVLLSRSGTAKDGQKKALHQLQMRGCHVEIVACDITKESDIHRLIIWAEQNQWQIKGVIQATTVLKVSIHSI